MFSFMSMPSRTSLALLVDNFALLVHDIVVFHARTYGTGSSGIPRWSARFQWRLVSILLIDGGVLIQINSLHHLG
jgi:hypothetical protein